jgi:erythromycin esterase-like protein
MTDETWKTRREIYPWGWATVLIEKDHPEYQALIDRVRSGTADPREYKRDDGGALWVAPTWVWK